MPNHTRRNFLRRLAGATTAGALAPGLFAAAKPAKSKAARGDLKANDVIRAVNGRDVKDLQAFF